LKTLYQATPLASFSLVQTANVRLGTF
jgi:hypothetical protein